MSFSAIISKVVGKERKHEIRMNEGEYFPKINKIK